MTRVEAPSRLHFGLLSLPGVGVERWPGLDNEPGLPMRRFGGVGLMIDQPRLAVQVEQANEWRASGALATRALAFAQHFVRSLGKPLAFHVTVQSVPPEHIGLGVGTQLALAVAKAIAEELGHGDWPAIELAKRAGRGERSAIGIHGFDRGGLIVEGGKLPGEAVSPLVGRYPFPSEWAVLVLTPPGEAKWHGDAERDALEELAPTGDITDRLCRIILTGLLPALAAKDLQLFGDALFEFNARVGDMFAPAQGGRYASQATTDCVAHLRSLGVRGVGQSSWGPSVFAVVAIDQIADITSRLGALPFLLSHASTGAAVTH